MATKTKKRQAKKKTTTLDDSIFSGLSESEQPMQRVVPVEKKNANKGNVSDKKTEELVLMSLQVTRKTKKKFDVYAALSGISLKDLLTEGANEYMKSHPAENI